MTNSVNVVGLYVRDQDEALDFYVGKLGFEVHTDVRNGDYRWLTVRSPGQDGVQLGLFRPGPPVHDAATTASLQQLLAKGAMPPPGARGGRLPGHLRSVATARGRVHPGTGRALRRGRCRIP